MCHQPGQLSYIIGEQLKEAVEDADRKRALKDVSISTVKDKGKAAEAVEKKVHAAKKDQSIMEKKLTETEVKLGSIELKLAKAESLNLAQADTIVDLKAALQACKEKWYNEGFADAENSVEPIVHQA